MTPTSSPQAASLAERLPELVDLLDNLAADDRRLVEDAYLGMLAAAPRNRPVNLHPMVRSHPPAVAAAAVAKGLARERATRAALVAESWSTAQTAELLGISAAAVTKRRTKGTLIAFKHKGDWRYPRWQFAGSEMLAGVIEAWRALPDRHDLIGLVRWFTLPSRQLRDRTPIGALRDGDLASVADAASYVGSR